MHSLPRLRRALMTNQQSADLQELLQDLQSHRERAGQERPPMKKAISFSSHPEMVAMTHEATYNHSSSPPSSSSPVQGILKKNSAGGVRVEESNSLSQHSQQRVSTERERYFNFSESQQRQHASSRKDESLGEADAASLMPQSLAVLAAQAGSTSSMSTLSNGSLSNNPWQRNPSQNTSTAIGLTVTLAHDKEDIGRELQMFSFRKNGWEKIEVRHACFGIPFGTLFIGVYHFAKVIDYEPSKRLHKCRHTSDGNVQWIDLSKKPIRELPPSDLDED